MTNETDPSRAKVQIMADRMVSVMVNLVAEVVDKIPQWSEDEKESVQGLAELEQSLLYVGKHMEPDMETEYEADHIKAKVVRLPEDRSDFEAALGKLKLQTLDYSGTTNHALQGANQSELRI